MFTTQGGLRSIADESSVVITLDFGHVAPLEILTLWANNLLRIQRPSLPDWVIEGLVGQAAIFENVSGVRNTESVRLPQLAWPNPASDSEALPNDAFALPRFDVMFDPKRKVSTLPIVERWKFKFHAALFARWSLFGPAPNGRNRNAYWAYVELARRQGVSEALFRECYGMDWGQACAEMRAYLKSRNLGMIEVRMPHVMRDVPEVDAMEFREATPEEVRRILGELNRLRARTNQPGS